MAVKLEQYLVGMTPEGGQKLAGNNALREAVELYVAEDEPEKFAPAGSRMLGIGKHSFTFLVEGVALKVSSPTSSQKAFDTGQPVDPEDLSEQFTVLAALSVHLRQTSYGVFTPEQYFVVRTPVGAYLLAQEYLEGWTSLEKRASHLYGDRDLTDADLDEAEEVVAGLRVRVTRALEGFPMRGSINDLGLHHPRGLHGGNLMVPIDEPLRATTKLAIIDQPTRKRQ
jgi:hypothetical protein